MATTNPVDLTNVIQVAWNILSTGGALFVAVLALIINRRSAINAENATANAIRATDNAEMKLRLDFFEKRYAVYAAIREFIGQIISSGSISEADVLTLRTKTAEAKFFFYPEVQDTIQRILDHAIIVQIANDEAGGTGDPALRQVSRKKKWDAITAITNETEQLQAVFMPYLDARPLKCPKTGTKWPRNEA